ncbi:hypothetical protein ACFFQW_28395 [Umezawaea endophytica]|uniref:Uncharacterized protein n=1 Tax=Umezawaea endophytica TaxID=1654476 RepID=A0A9X3AH12_9PSEU|nr:hypothetical protein [Umezawaea endophytica]MCS7480827.1 hypothetical protein [Umezawaea endophytica]
MREDDLRDVFGALHAGSDPDLGFDVTDVVRAGERVRRRRRTAAAVGSGLATVAAVVVVIVLLPGERGPVPVEPAGPDVGWTTTTEPVPSTTAPSAEAPPSAAPRDVTPAEPHEGTPPSAAREVPRADPVES